MSKGVLTFSLAVLLSAGLLLGHGNATHLKGTVTAVDAPHFTFTIKQTDGKPVSVMTDKFTKYLDKNEKPTPSTELKVGARVVVDAKMDNTAKMYVAEEVRIGAASPAPAPVKAPAKPAATKAGPPKSAAPVKK